MNLRSRLLALVLLATLLPALLMGWRFFRESAAEIATAMKALAAATDNISVDLEHRVQGTAQLHYGLAHSRLLDNADREECSLHLSRVREAYPQYTGILTVLPDGELFCDSLRTGRRLNLADRGYYRRVMAGSTGVTLEPVFGRLTGNSVLQVVYPARTDDGALRFMLVASLNLQTFAQESLKHTPHPATELLLVDQQGTVMAWTGGSGPHAAPGASAADSAPYRLAQSLPDGGTGELAGPGGVTKIWAVAAAPSLKAAGLRLLLGVPKPELLADARRTLRQGATMLTFSALLLFAGVWLLAEWGIRRQVGRITSMVRALGAGDLEARIAAPHPRGELGELMAVLNSTASSLKEQRAAIEELGLKLRQAQKLEAIGTLAGGIAHDFNNILGAILGNLSLAQQEIAEGQSADESLQQIQRAALRARDLVQGIQAFGRVGNAAKAPQDLGGIVEEVLSLVAAAMPASATLLREVQPLPGPVRGDATQLHQVLMNLCTNAWQALQGRPGTVTVGLEAVDLDTDPALRPPGTGPGPHARFWVRDTGAGMEPQVRERIFEPFFTTKGAQGGTGLGLSVVHGIVSAHHGAVRVASVPGQGSIFTLYLPLLQAATPAAPAATGTPEAAPPPQAPERLVPGQGQQVLCVDDDEVMGLLTERLLVRAGYRASCHAGGAAALAALQADPQAYDVLVTDYNMPGMSGLDVSRAAVLLRPDLPVILISGYVFDELPEQARAQGVFEVIRKQSVLEDLLPAIQRALRSAHPSSD